jgi:hypothetical protein
MGKRTGYASLPLRGGKAPVWLFSRMVLLSREILAHIMEEYGTREVPRRLSDPFWFQAFGCVLGFDWHSSGVTTTVCGAVKESLRDTGTKWGLCRRGKGAASRKSPLQIADACEHLYAIPTHLSMRAEPPPSEDNAAVQEERQRGAGQPATRTDAQKRLRKSPTSDSPRGHRRRAIGRVLRWDMIGGRGELI